MKFDSEVRLQNPPRRLLDFSKGLSIMLEDTRRSVGNWSDHGIAGHGIAGHGVTLHVPEFQLMSPGFNLIRSINGLRDRKTFMRLRKKALEENLTQRRRRREEDGDCAVSVRSRSSAHHSCD